MVKEIWPCLTVKFLNIFVFDVFYFKEIEVCSFCNANVVRVRQLFLAALAIIVVHST